MLSQKPHICTTDVEKNEKADALANKAISKNNKLSYTTKEGSILDFSPIQNKHIIDIGIRNFIKIYITIREEAEWSINYNIKEI